MARLRGSLFLLVTILLLPPGAQGPIGDSGAAWAEELPDLTRSPLAWKDAAEWKGPHYRVRSNSGKAFAERVGRHVELFYDAFFRFFEGTSVRTHPVQNQSIFVFHRVEDFREYMRTFHAGKDDDRAYFDPDNQTVYLHREVEKGKETTFRTVNHEATHQLLRNAANQVRGMSGALNFWVSEGLPAYFEGMVEKDGKLLPGLPPRMGHAVALMDRGQLLPLDEFIRILHANYKGPAVYAQGCALAHLLLEGEDGVHRKPFLEYVKRVLQGRGQEDTFRTCFGADISTFDSRLRAHLDQLAGRVDAGSDLRPPLVPPASLSKLTRAALDLARAGQPEAEELTEILGAMGLPAREAAAIRGAARKAKPKAASRTAGRARKRAAKAVAREVNKLAKSLEGLAEPDRLRLARWLLRLDSGCGSALLVLGRETPSHARKALSERERRRAAVLRAPRAAMRLEIPLQVVESADPVLAAGAGGKGWCVSTGAGVELHTALPPDRGERILRDALRTAAYAHFLLTGKLEVPRIARRCRLILFDSREAYASAVDAAVGRRFLRSDARERARRSATISGLDGSCHLYLQYKRTLGHAVVSTFGMLMRRTNYRSDRRSLLGKGQACLQAGLLNLACLAMVGQRKPGTGSQNDVADAVSEATKRLTGMGPLGVGRHLRRLLETGQAPTWKSCMVSRESELEPDALAKSTSMVQFLAEERALASVVRETWPSPAGAGSAPAAFESALGEPLTSVESRWRAWLMQDASRSLVDRLAGEAEVTREARDLVKALNAIRRPAPAEPVDLEGDLSGGARCHALYRLLRARWGKQSEDPALEDPVRTGYSHEGARAGLASLVAHGAKDVESTLEKWLMAVPDRSALLHPGLAFVGWAREDDVAVLDARSLRYSPKDWTIRWPHDGMKNVPTTGQPLGPAGDGSPRGYPVTVQICRSTVGCLGMTVTMTLRQKSASGSVVPGEPVTPYGPGTCAPADVWGLIPNAPLSPGTRYHVEVVTRNPDETIRWSFRTGSDR